MPEKIVFLLGLLLITVCIFPVYARDTPNIDDEIDFYKTMRDFDLLRNPEGFPRQTRKIVLLVGTISVISPAGSFDFLYTKEDILSPAAFVSQFEDPAHKVTAYLAQHLSSRTKAGWSAFTLEDKITALLRDINRTLRETDLYTAVPLQPLDYPDYTKEFTQASLADDEQAFLNRLLVDKILNNIVTPVTITIELIRGEWYGYERVESYSSIIRFTGSTAFRVFKRRREYEASDYMIPLNSRVLVAAIPGEIGTSPFGKKETWIFDGLHVRKLK